MEIRGNAIGHGAFGEVHQSSERRIVLDGHDSGDYGLVDSYDDTGQHAITWYKEQ